MSDTDKTTFENKCDILSDLWMNYRFEKQFEDFVNYNDLGLPPRLFDSRGRPLALATG